MLDLGILYTENLGGINTDLVIPPRSFRSSTEGLIRNF